MNEEEKREREKKVEKKRFEGKKKLRGVTQR